jgi:hypothetical protein
VKVAKEEKIVGVLTTDDLRRAIEREGLVIPSGSSLGLYLVVDGRYGGVEHIHVGYGVTFEFRLPYAKNEQG